jgi:hypothetical protein
MVETHCKGGAAAREADMITYRYFARAYWASPAEHERFEDELTRQGISFQRKTYDQWGLDPARELLCRYSFENETDRDDFQRYAEFGRDQSSADLWLCRQTSHVLIHPSQRGL